MKNRCKHIEIIAGVELDKYEILKEQYDILMKKHIEFLHYCSSVEDENKNNALTILLLDNEIKGYKQIFDNPDLFFDNNDLKIIESYLRKKKLKRINNDTQK